MPSRNVVRQATIPGYANAKNAPIYVDSDDNKLKIIPAGSGTTEVEVVDASSSQTLTNKTITTPVATLAVEAVTALGTNQATAAPITASAPALLTVTGATDTGALLPAATVGKIYFAKKLTTDTISVYPTGSETINGSTDAVAIGAIGIISYCVVAGAWRAMNIAS